MTSPARTTRLGLSTQRWFAHPPDLNSGGEGEMMTDELGQLIGRGATAELYAWREDQVLKLFFPSWPRIAVEMEVQAARVASEAAVPTPAVGEIVELDGRYGIVFERVRWAVAGGAADDGPDDAPLATAASGAAVGGTAGGDPRL